MAEYIKREAAIAALKKVRDDQRVFKYATVSDFLSARDAIERAAKVLDSLPAADVEPVQEWISVDDRLPDKPMRCLVYTKRGGYCGYDITYYNQGFYSEYSKVTHWMPLPHPPKGE